MSTATTVSDSRPSPGSSARVPAAKLSDRRLHRRSAGSDRRYHSRMKLDLLVNRFLNGHPYMCRMTDISRTGARLVPILEPELPHGPRFVGLQFQLPGRDEILTASGEMVSLDADTETSRAVGVRFTNLPPDAAWAIEAFLGV
jgi:hypothetical protein